MLKIVFEASEKPSAEIKTVAPEKARAEGARAYATAKSRGARELSIETPGFSAAAAAQLAEGLLRASYAFDKYKSAPEAKPEKVIVKTDDPKAAAAAFEAPRTTIESVFWASDLANEPANVLNPETYAARVKAELEPLGIKVRIIENDELKQMGAGAITAVGQGSRTPPRLVVLEYDGTGGEQKRPLALVGKGITFDTGGISIKPAANMGDMGLDMSGSAAVAGALRALALRGSKSHVVGVLALAENMPGPDSYRPGDIIKSLSGKTVYIDNTDAEGRLVLADALTYVQRTHNPAAVVDIATLTGAAASALGPEFAAVLTPSEKLWREFNRASAKSGDKVWRMPLAESESFRKAVTNTPHADLRNAPGGAAGASTAAAFLREFVEGDRPFAHIDMAGPGTHGNGSLKGYGVALFDQFVRDFFEKKGAANQDHACQCGGACGHNHGAGHAHKHGPSPA